MLWSSEDPARKVTRPYLRVTRSEGLPVTEAEDTCDFIRRADRIRDRPPDWCCSADPGRTGKLELNLLNWRLTIFDVVSNPLRASCKCYTRISDA